MKKYTAKVRKEITGYIDFDLEEGQSISDFLDEGWEEKDVNWELFPYSEVEYILNKKTGEEIMDYSITG